MKKLGFSNGNIKSNDHKNVSMELSDLQTELRKPSIQKTVTLYRQTKEQDVKETLPLVMANFGKEGHLKDSGIYNGVIPIDIDARKDLTLNEQNTLQTAAWGYFSNLESTMLCYVSPSGNGGVKAFISISMNANEYDGYFTKITNDFYEAVGEDIRSLLHKSRIDKREAYNPQFACYEMVYINEDHEDYPIDPEDLKALSRHDIDMDELSKDVKPSEIKRRIETLNYTPAERKIIGKHILGEAAVMSGYKDGLPSFDTVVADHLHNDFIFNYYKKASYNALDFDTAHDFLTAWSFGEYDSRKLSDSYTRYQNNDYFGRCLVKNDILKKLNRDKPQIFETQTVINLSSDDFVGNHIDKLDLTNNKRLAIIAPTSAGKTTAFNGMMDEIKKTETDNITIVCVPTVLQVKNLKRDNPTWGTSFGEEGNENSDYKDKTTIASTYDSFAKTYNHHANIGKKVDIFADEVHVFAANAQKNDFYNKLLKRSETANRFYTFTGTPIHNFDKRLALKTIKFTKPKTYEQEFTLVEYPENKRTESLFALMQENNEKYPNSFHLVLLQDKTKQLSTITTNCESIQWKTMVINSNKDDKTGEDTEAYKSLAAGDLVSDDIKCLITTSTLQNGLSIGFESKRDLFVYYLKGGQNPLSVEELHQMAERPRESKNTLGKRVFLFHSKTDKVTGQFRNNGDYRIKKMEEVLKNILFGIDTETQNDPNYSRIAAMKETVKTNGYLYYDKTLSVNYLTYSNEWFITERNNTYNDLNYFKEKMKGLGYKCQTDIISSGLDYVKADKKASENTPDTNKTKNEKNLAAILKYCNDKQISTLSKTKPKVSADFINANDQKYVDKFFGVFRTVNANARINDKPLEKTAQVISIIEKYFINGDSSINDTDAVRYFEILSKLNLLTKTRFSKEEITAGVKEDKTFFTNLLSLEIKTYSTKDFYDKIGATHKYKKSQIAEFIDFFYKIEYKTVRNGDKTEKCYIVKEKRTFDFAAK